MLSYYKDIKNWEERILENNSKDLANVSELNQKKNVFGNIAQFFISRYKLVYLLIVGLIIFGGMTYASLPKETMPDVSMNRVVVVTAYPGGSVEDVERLITEPLEDSFRNVKDVDDITSTTENGMSQITVAFSDGTDMDQAELEINNEVISFKLPNGAMEPRVVSIETGELPLMTFSITGEYNLVELKTIAENIEDKITKIEGVRDVDIVGGYDREIQVVLSAQDMMTYGVDATMIKNALTYSNINMPAGSNEIDGEIINIRVDETFKNVEEIENLLLISNPQATVFLSDVATVVDGFADTDKYAYTYSKEKSHKEEVTPTISITAYRETGYDVVQPSEEIRKVIEIDKANELPDDLVVDITFDQSEQVEESLSDVINSATGGLIVVMLVLYIFIGLNEALIVSSVIPLSLLVTMVLMDLFGISFNTISLTGFIIALGLLVDNAIVVIENVDRLRDNNIDRKNASIFGINQVGSAILAATLTTVLAFLPVSMLPGTMGEFIAVMPKVVIFIISASLAISIIVTPTLCSRFLTSIKKKKELESKKKDTKMQKYIPIITIFVLATIAFLNEGKLEIASLIAAVAFVALYLAKRKYLEKEQKEKLINRYGSYLEKLLENKKKKIVIYITVVAVLIGSFATIPAGILNLELFPEEEPTAFSINIEGPVGTMIKDTEKVTYAIEQKLYKYDEIESFTIEIGNSGEHTAIITAELTESDSREVSSNEVMTRVREDIKDIPGAKTTIEFTTSMSQMSGGDPVGLGFKGNNIEELETIAAAYLEVLENIEGVEDAASSADNGLKELVIDINNNKAIYYGLNVSQVSNEIREHIAGATVGIYKEDSNEIDIKMYYEEERIKSIDDFDQIYFENFKGQLVNFSDVATITIETGMAKIDHENSKKVVTVSSKIKEGYNANAIMKEWQNKTKDIHVPDSITVEKSGEAKELSNQITNMLNGFILAIILVYIVLVLQFNSLTQPLVIVLSVPFALIGVIWGLVLTGNNLGMFAMFGMVALVGIAVNEAIVLMDFVNYNKGQGMSINEAIVEAVKIRIMPVFATTLTTIGGVLPLAMYNDMFSQLGYAIVFGLLVSVILTLVLIPIIYLSVDRFAIKIGNRLKKINRL